MAWSWPLGQHGLFHCPGILFYFQCHCQECLKFSLFTSPSKGICLTVTNHFCSLFFFLSFFLSFFSSSFFIFLFIFSFSWIKNSFSFHDYKLTIICIFVFAVGNSLYITVVITACLTLLSFSFCSDVNECEINPDLCRNGECIDTRGSFRCRCFPGFVYNPLTQTCDGKRVVYSQPDHI